MALTNYIQDAFSIAGLNPGKTVKATSSKLTQWLIEAKAEKQSIDFLFFGDSNTAFSGDAFDLYNGLHDGFSRTLVNFGIPVYGSPIYFTGSNTNSYGLFNFNYGVPVNHIANSVGTKLNVTTATASGNVLYGTGHLEVGTPIVFAGTSFGGITAGTTYYINTIPSSSTFTLTAVQGSGTSITLSTASGSLTGTYTTGNATKTIIISNTTTSTNIVTCATITAFTASTDGTDEITVTSTTSLRPALAVSLSAAIGGAAANTNYSIQSLPSATAMCLTTTDVKNGALKYLSADADPEMATFKSDFSFPASPKYHFAGSTDGTNYPNDSTTDNCLKIEANTVQQNHGISYYFAHYNLWKASTSYSLNDKIQYQNTLYNCTTAHTSTTDFDPTKFSVLSSAPSVFAPLANQAFVGRILYAQTPNSASSYNRVAMFILPNPGTYEAATNEASNQLNASGPTAYKAYELRLPANPSRQLGGKELKFGCFGVYTGGQTNGKLAVFFMSLHVPDLIGFSSSLLHYRGGSHSTDWRTSLQALDTHNGMKLHQRFFQEVVNRQKSASSKNTGRVCIVIQGGVNTTPGATDAIAVDNFINDVKEVQRLLTKAWRDAGLPTSNLTFLVSTGPFVNEGTYLTLLRKEVFRRASEFTNTTVVKHEDNVPIAQYTANSYWSATNNAASGYPPVGSATPDAHLADNGYVNWANALVGNAVVKFKDFIKRYK
jgi:hypothetical protein